MAPEPRVRPGEETRGLAGGGVSGSADDLVIVLPDPEAGPDRP